MLGSFLILTNNLPCNRFLRFSLFEEVAVKLEQEGKGETHRDEMLFIDMIHRLNRQASDINQEETKDIRGSAPR